MTALRRLWPAALWTLAAPLSAAVDGSTSAEVLKFSAGARAAALGDAQIALAEGAPALDTNPAGLAGVSVGEIHFSHNKGLETVQEQRVQWALPLRSAGTLGLGYQRLSMDDFAGLDDSGAQTNDLNTGASVLTLGWGKNIARNASDHNGLFVGTALKRVSDTQADVTASGLAADVGLLIRPWGTQTAWVRRMGFGVTARNIGRGLTFDEESVPFPTSYGAGVSYSHLLSGDILSAELDVAQVSGEDAGLGMGVEYWTKNILALRAGYRDSGGDKHAWRLGAGIRFNRFQLDYAWAATAKGFSPTHRLSVTLRFAPPAPAPGLAGDLFNDAVQRGRRRMDLGLYDQAILDFQEALRIRPQDDTVLHLLLECGEKLRERVAP